MECDIHAYIEYKDKITGEWKQVLGELNLQRDYRFFNTLAGIREEDPALFSVRGLPADISDGVQFEWMKWKVNPYHAGWLNSQELNECIRQAGLFKEVDFNVVDIILYWLEINGYQTRFVFWFDN